MKENLIEIFFQYREAFASDNKPLGAIKCHDVKIILNVEILYPPLLRRPAYPASPRAREALETHTNELMKLIFLRIAGHNEELEVTKPAIITCNNDKSMIIGYFRAFNTYTIPERYPIPKIHETLTQLSKARFITSMGLFKRFHHSFLTPHDRKLLRIISHCGIYEYLRIPFGMKIAPSHYQRIMNTIFPHELSEMGITNTPDNYAYFHANAEPQIPIEGINITDVETKFIEEVSCDRFQKANEATGKRFGLVINIQEPSTSWQVVHIYWVTTLPTGVKKSYNVCLVIVDRYSKTPISLPCHKYVTAINTAILICNRVIYHTGPFKNIISDRDPKFMSALLMNLHKLFGTEISFSTAYHTHTDGLAERMIQTLEDIIRRFCAYGLEFKDSDGFTHYWFTLIPALELAYKTSIHALTGKTPAMLEKGWNPKLPVDTLKKYLVDIYPAASRFKLLLDKVRHCANHSMTYSFEYAKKKWDNSHKTPEFKVGDLILKAQKYLKISFKDHLFLKPLMGKCSTSRTDRRIEKKHQSFLVNLVNHYISSDKELFPLRN
ncbi:hypothetical protein O181_033853 [Austropuccinia psidii MF-1]|uniref:Integrase catalytic domain-containing protein n=1 Tax=Austropuccinia psidii MF-1 TaxID=1389203 RepID=A0A9Q3H6U2_9BASI|nr:hypothetical protein [Austropuccinia psidii MF-1]